MQDFHEYVSEILPPGASVHPRWKVMLSNAVELFGINHLHFGREVPLVSTPDAVGDIKCTEVILSIFDRIEITDATVKLWEQSSKSSARSALNTVTTYADTDPKCPVSTRLRLQCSAKALHEDIEAKTELYDAANLLMALAQNGARCNVQKEVGIRMVYSSMFNTQANDCKAEGLEARLLTLLIEYREQLAEELAYTVTAERHGGTRNTHYLIPIREAFANEIGLPSMPDPQASVHPTDDDREKWLNDFLDNYYTSPKVHEYVRRCLNDRKVPYDAIVNWFTENRPPTASFNQDECADAASEQIPTYDWLSLFVFDMDSGEVTAPAVTYLLSKIGVLSLGNTRCLAICTRQALHERKALTKQSESEFDALLRRERKERDTVKAYLDRWGEVLASCEKRCFEKGDLAFISDKGKINTCLISPECRHHADEVKERALKWCVVVSVTHPFAIICCPDGFTAKVPVAVLEFFNVGSPVKVVSEGGRGRLATVKCFMKLGARHRYPGTYKVVYEDKTTFHIHPKDAVLLDVSDELIELRAKVMKEGIRHVDPAAVIPAIVDDEGGVQETQLFVERQPSMPDDLPRVLSMNEDAHEIDVA